MSESDSQLIRKHEFVVSFRMGTIQIRDVGDVGEAEITESFQREKVAESPDCTLLTFDQIREAGFTRVRFELHEHRPPLNADRWDHIVECNLWMPTGELEIDVIGESICDGSTLETCGNVFPVGPAGMYRLYVCFGNLKLTDERLDAKEIDLRCSPEMPSREELNRLEFIDVFLWPVATHGLKLHKAYQHVT
jgi:hypothetical protein